MVKNIDKNTKCLVDISTKNSAITNLKCYYCSREWLQGGKPYLPERRKTMNILECTIKMKQETRDHYARLAGAVDEGQLKHLFTLLADAEDQHVTSLMRFRDNLGRLDVQDLSRLEESVCVYSSRIDPEHVQEELSSDPDAYRHVVRDEEETIEMFDQLGNQADSELLRRICRLQAEKEREHLAMLENIYSFIEEPRTFLEWGEFSNLKAL